MTKFAYRDAVTNPPPSRVQRWRPILPPPPPGLRPSMTGNCMSGASTGRWAGAGLLPLPPPQPPPPPFAGQELNDLPRIGLRGALRRRSDPWPDVRSGIMAQSTSGSHSFDARSVGRGSLTRPYRGGSLECLQYVGHLVHDLLPNNHAAGDESDLSSEASSYSVPVARSRRASLSVDSDGASSSGVSSLSSTGPAPAPVALAVLADAALADAALANVADAALADASAATPSVTPCVTPCVTPEVPNTRDDAEKHDLLDVTIGAVVQDSRGANSPDYQDVAQRVVWYQGRNLLDLSWNLQCSPWPLRYAELPSASPQFFLQNRAQYHRLGPYGLQSPERSIRCRHCCFLLPQYY